VRAGADLRPYQAHAVDFVCEKRRCALFMDMGLGKTATVLTAVARMQAEFSLGPVIVFAPLKVCRMVWPNEVKVWEHTSGLRVSVAAGADNAKERLAALLRPADIYVLNHDNAAWFETQFQKRPFPVSGIIVDESSGYKDKSTARWKAMRRMARRVDTLVLLTGTPAPNALYEVHPQIALIDGGERLGTSLVRFKEDHFRALDYNGYKLVVREGHAELIYEAIRDVCITLKSEDYLTLPDRLYQDVPCELSPHAMEQYKEMQKHAVLEMANDGVIEGVTAATLAGKLLQMAAGAVYDAERKIHALHDVKIEALKEIVAEEPHENFLVAYNYKHDLARLQEAFPYAVVMGKDPDVERAWNAGEIRMLLAHPKSAGHGLNLQFGGCNIIWFTLTYSLEQYLQFNKRLHRSGQLRPVLIRHLIALGTIDEHVLRVLAGKDSTQNEMLNALRIAVADILRGMKNDLLHV